MRRRRGFTLVEVLVALGLLVLVASLALPVALTNTARARATTAERMLSLAPSAARGEARRLGAPVALVLLPTEDGTEDGGPLRLAMVRQGDPQGDQPADPDDVESLQQFYREYHPEPPDFPPEYPSGCLLGCVDVLEVLPADEYAATFPDGESESPYVFVCANPQALVVKFPVTGKHKLWRLEKDMLAAAKAGAQPVIPRATKFPSAS